MSQDSESLKTRARAIRLSALYFREEEFNPFVERTPLGSPLMPLGYLRQDQFQAYMIRYLGEDSFTIDLFGKNGRILSLTYSEFRQSKYQRVDASKHSADQIFTQIYSFKINASETFIKATIDSRLGSSHSIFQPSSNVFAYNFDIEGKTWKEKKEEYRDLITPSLEYDHYHIGSWNAVLSNTSKSKSFAISSANWYAYDELEKLVDLFLNKDSMFTVLALKEPRWQEIALRPTWQMQRFKKRV